VLDLHFIEHNAELIRRNNADRHVEVDVDALVAASGERKRLIAVGEALRVEAKGLAGKGRSDADIARARAIKEEERVAKADLAAVEERVKLLQARIPNLTHPETPRGEEADFAVRATPDEATLRRRGGAGDHVDVMTAQGWLDMEAGTSVAGPGFYFLRGDAVLLEMALVRYALDMARAHGFALCTTPEMVREEILVGTGFTPRGDETNTYNVEGTDLCLIGTAEMPLCGQFRGRIVEAAAGAPIRTCGVSHCFRTERAAGRATRGLYRVHQFTKVELVVVCTPEESEAEHARLLALERAIFDGLEIPYRVLDVASGDLGASAYRKFDLEAWMPGRGEDGAFGEVTSASNCLDYQARRLGIRYRREDGKPALAHTLNGTAIATGRAMIALIENHLDGDRVRIPAALVPFYGADTMGG